MSDINGKCIPTACKELKEAHAVQVNIARHNDGLREELRDMQADNARLRGIMAEALAVIEYECLHCDNLNHAACSPCCMAYAVKIKLRAEVEK